MTKNFLEAAESQIRHGRSLAPLQAVANKCSAGNCPTVYKTGAGTLVVQGYVVAASNTDVDLPAGETMVEIPYELLIEAVRGLS
jgi:hypothetical protein